MLNGERNEFICDELLQQQGKISVKPVDTVTGWMYNIAMVCYFVSVMVKFQRVFV